MSMPWPVRTSEVPLAQWAKHPRVAEAAEWERLSGYTGMPWDHRALADSGIAVADQQMFAGNEDLDAEAIDIGTLLAGLAQRWPSMTVRDAMGWLIVLQHLRLESIVTEVQFYTLLEVEPTVAAWAALDERLLGCGWAFLAAGVTPAEAAAVLTDAEDGAIDTSGLVAVAALRGYPTPVA